MLGVGLTGPAAKAACSFDNGNTNVYTLGGTVCSPSGSAYNSTVPPGPPPPFVPPVVPYTGYAILAYTTTASPLAQIKFLAPVSISTPNVTNAYGVWSNGPGSQIAFSGLASVTTTGTDAFGFYASNKGLISTNPSATVAIDVSAPGTAALKSGSGGTIAVGGGTAASSGDKAIGLYATGPGSQVSASGLAVTSGSVSTTGAIGLKSEAGGTIIFIAGSVHTVGTGAIGAASQGDGSALQLSGGTDFHVDGNGSIGLLTSSSSDPSTSKSSMKADSITVSVAGGALLGLDAGAAFNANVGAGTIGGLLNVSNSTLETTGGLNTFGVYTADGGSTLLTGDTISVAASTIYAGVESGPNGTTTINGGTVATQGSNSIAVYAHGAAAQVFVGYSDPLTLGSPVGISTLDVDSPGVRADGGGLAKLNGGTINTSGDGSFGLYVTGSGSQIVATGVAVTTHGGVSEATGWAANGVVAEAGGVATLSGGSVTTAGVNAEGLFDTAPGRRSGRLVCWSQRAGSVRLASKPIWEGRSPLTGVSRNRYLDDVDREQASALSAALLAGMYAASGGPASALDAARAVLEEVPAIAVDYLEVRDPMLGPAPAEGIARMLVAARLGNTSSDNIAIDIGATAGIDGHPRVGSDENHELPWRN